MVQLTTQGSEPAMNAMDSALKPRLRRRSVFEYAAWAVCILIALGLLTSVVDQSQLPVGCGRQILHQ